MLEKPKNKIPVLNKMIGLGEEVMLDNTYLVPQNSLINMKNFNQRFGLSEPQRLDSSTCDSIQTSESMCQCPNCENMAKNFLFLEGLIRYNCSASSSCNVCHSSLQYLQTVNKNIMKVFGNSDNIVQAAKVCGHQFETKEIKKALKLRGKPNKKLTSSGRSNNKANTSKRITLTKTASVAKSGIKLIKNHATGSSKTPIKTRLKKSIKKTNLRNNTSTYTATDTVAGKRVKAKKLASIKSKTKHLFRKLKSIS